MYCFAILIFCFEWEDEEYFFVDMFASGSVRTVTK